MRRNIVVLGDGAWAQALTTLAKVCGHNVTVWSRRSPSGADFANAHAILVAIPAQALGAVLAAVPVNPAAVIIITAKGICRDTGRFMHEVAQAVRPANTSLILSGPSFAEDVSRHLPTAVTLSCNHLATATQWAAALSRPYFRIYATDDVMGVALGGSTKNVMAIACGISDGQRLGDSARAALIARGFSEISRLARALGAKPETLMGLSGLGDLLLTCTSPQSRNYAFGKRLGEGMAPAEALSRSNGVVEGVYSAKATVARAHAHAIVMPIVSAVANIVDGTSSPRQEIENLLARPVTTEFNGLEP